MSETPLTAVHRELGAFLVERAGLSLPSYFTDAREEHEAVRSAAGLFDLSSAGKFEVRGRERVRFLQGLLTIDFRLLPEGTGGLSMLLTPDGRIASLLRVCVLPDRVVLLTPSMTRGKVMRMLERLRAAGDVEIVDGTLGHVLLSVQGPKSDEVVREVFGTVPDVEVGGGADIGEFVLLRLPRTGGPGWDVVAPSAGADALFRRLLASVQSAGGAPAGLDALDSLRIEAGRPVYGADIDERTHPHEAGLIDDVISFDKGCFLGQEAVSAAEFHGKAERKLRGIVFRSRIAPVQGDRVLLNEDTVGSITSACFVPTRGHALAIAMLDAPVVRTGTAVRTADGELGIVTPLPFPKT